MRIIKILFLIFFVYSCTNAKSGIEKNTYTNSEEKYTEAQVLHSKGLAEARNQNFQSALPLLLKADSLNPKHIKNVTSIGAIYKHLGKFELAIQYYNRGLKLDPLSYSLHGDIGDCYLKLGNEEKAIQEFSTLIKLDPTQYQGTFLLGQIYAKQKLYEKAKAYFTQTKLIIKNLNFNLISW